jgi:hypothetical protein
VNRIARLAVSDEGFIFDPERGNSFTTNGPGLFILKLLKEGKDEAAVIGAMTKRYAIPPGEAERDYVDFRNELRRHLLVEADDE